MSVKFLYFFIKPRLLNIWSQYTKSMQVSNSGFLGPPFSDSGNDMDLQYID